MENNTFNYTYSAKEQAELAKIRKKYMPAEQDKLAYVRKLDRSVANKATTWSLVIGLIGMGIVAVAYPVYARILKREREKVAPEILRLTEQIIN